MGAQDHTHASQPSKEEPMKGVHPGLRDDTRRSAQRPKVNVRNDVQGKVRNDVQGKVRSDPRQSVRNDVQGKVRSDA
jgi:hypothetical protein